MNKKHQNLRWNRFLIVFSVLLTAFILNACRKVDRPKDDKVMDESAMRKKFFTIKPGTDPTVAAIAASVKRQDEKKNIVKKLANKAGYPLWDKAKITKGNPYGQRGSSETEDEDQVFIPFVQQDSNSTEAILIVKLTGDDTLYRLQYGSRYSQYGFDTTAHPNLNARTIFHWFTLFDHDIFGHTDFNVTDNRLLNDTANDKARIESVSQVQGRASVGSFRVWVTFMTYECKPKMGFKETGSQTTSTTSFCGEGYYAAHIAYTTVPVTYFFDDNDTPDNPADDFGWYDESGNFHNSSGGGSTCEGCSWADTNPCDMVNGVYVTICDETWGPVYNAVPEQFDPYAADSVRVSDVIRDSFPCAYALLKSTLYNPNIVTQVAMIDFFTHNMKAHIYFKISDTMTCGSSFSAKSRYFATTQTINNIQHWTDTIEFNRCFLQTASREMIVAVMLHEPIHAFALWCVDQYNRFSGAPPYDSTFLKTHFGIYWESMVANKPYNHVADHDIMVDSFLTYMSNVIYTYGNSNASHEKRKWVADRLAATGLQNTSAWGIAPGVTDICNIAGVAYWGRFHTAASAPYNPWSPAGMICRDFDTGFRDSLQMQRGDSCN